MIDRRASRGAPAPGRGAGLAAGLLALLAILPPGASAANPEIPPPPAAKVPVAAASMPPILAGAAVRTITPDLGPEAQPVGMAGFSIGRVAEGVRDDLQARALVLEAGAGPVAIVTLDLYGIERADAEKIRAAVRARPEAPRFAGIMIAATRTHAGADLTGRFAAAGLAVDPAWKDRVVRAAAEAVEAAWRERRPARLSFATTRLPRLIADARQPTRLDDRAVLVRIESVSGRNGIAALAGFAAMPESLGRKSRLLSADYPGDLRRALDESFGGVALFLSGASGGRMTPVAPAGTDPAVAPAEVGGAIARGLLVAWSEREEAREPAPADTTHASIEWKSTTVRLGAEAPPRAAALFGGEGGAGDPAGVTTEVGLLTLRTAGGPILQVACLPGSIYPELFLGGIPDPQDPAADIPGAARETPVRSLLQAQVAMIAGVCGDDVGEIIPASEWDERPPFAYGLKSPQRGEESSPGPGTAAALLKALGGLLR